MTRRTQCRKCGTEIVMVPIVKTTPTSDELREIPLDVRFDPATSPVRASHALNPSRTACHPITKDWPIGAGEVPALTHFATCPARHRPTATTATTRGPR